MSFFSAAEAAKIKRFDPQNMPAFARFIRSPKDVADMLDPASPRRLWLYRPHWGELETFFNRKATLHSRPFIHMIWYPAL